MSDVATVPAPEAAPRGKWGARSIASLLIFIIAAVFTPIALVGHWGHRTVIDSERYIQTVGPLVQQPEVQAALSTSVTDAVVAKLNTQSQVEGLLNGVFKDNPLVGAIAAPIATGINGLIGDLVTKFIASPQFETVWIELNKTAQKGLVAALSGDPTGPVQIQGENVVLDISSALVAVQKHLVDSGITVAGNITVPQVDRQIVLMSSPALAQARFIYSFTSPILRWFPLIIALLFALSIALARRRARTVVATGIVLVVSALLLAIGLAVGQEQFVNQLASTPFAPAANVFWDTLFAYLVGGIKAIFWLGVILIVAGWFGGRTTFAQRLRGEVVSGLNEIGGRLPGGLRPLGEVVHRYQEWLRWGVYAIGVLILLFSGLLVTSTVLWVVALVAGLVTAIQVLAGTGSATPPPAALESSVPADASVTTESPSVGDATIR